MLHSRRPAHSPEPLRSQAKAQHQVLDQPLRWLFPRVDNSANYFLGVIEAFLVKHPMALATQRQAAVHESAHLLAFAWADLEPFDAVIHNSHGNPRAWGGYARGWGAGAYGCREWSGTSLCREAVTILAGPVAEARLGGGDALSSSGEILEVVLLACKAADLMHEDLREIFQRSAFDAVALVERHAADIHELGEILARKKHIRARSRPIAQILARAAGDDVQQALSPAGAAIADLMIGAHDELGDLAANAGDLIKLMRQING